MVVSAESTAQVSSQVQDKTFVIESAEGVSQLGKVGISDKKETSAALLAKMEAMQSFMYEENSNRLLRFGFGQDPERVSVRYILGDGEEKTYPYVNETIVVPNMVDVGRFKYTNTVADKFTVLCTGHLKENKSVNMIIEAFNQAFSKEENVELVIAGDGDEKEKLIRLSDRLGLNGKILFVGKCSRDQMVDLFAGAQLFALTSRVETFGIVYIIKGLINHLRLLLVVFNQLYHIFLNLLELV
jgi:glycosyltransferase involved in cell wall biosynthesis